MKGQSASTPPEADSGAADIIEFDRAGACLLTADRLYVEPGRIVGHGWLYVEHGLISSLGEGTPPPAEGAARLDLRGLALVPGLVDAHVHLDMDPGDGLDPAGRAARIADAGIAAVRDGGDRLSRVLKAKPSISPKLFLAASGPALHAPGRYGKWIGRAVGDRAEMTSAVAELTAAGVDQIKVMASGLVSLDEFGCYTGPQFELEDLKHLVLEAGRHGLGVMAHANGPEAVSLCAAAGVASVEHGYFMGREALQRLADAGTAWTPTIQCLDSLAQREDPDSPRREVIRRILADQVEQLALARQLGVGTAIGTDLGTPGLCAGPALRREMPWYLKAGFTGEELLASATALGADLLNAGGCLGRLLPGRIAFVAAYPAEESLEEVLLKKPSFIGRPADLTGALR